jgi:hypothetical protein
MNLIFAAAGFAEMTPAQSRQFEFDIFLASTIPALAYFVIASLIWIVANRRDIRRLRISVRSLAILVAILSPGLALLRLVFVPYWFYAGE